MKPLTQQHPLEARVPKIIEAYRQFPQPHVPLHFAEGLLMPQEVISRLQKGVEVIAEVRRRSEALAVAIEERDRVVPKLRDLAAEATRVAKSHLGPSAKETVALAVPRRHRPKAKPRCPAGAVVEVVVTTVVEEVILPTAERRRRPPKRARR